MANIIEITDFSAPELDIYARLNENQLSHYYEPELGLFIAESPKVVERALNAGYEPVSFLVEKKHIEGEAKDVLARCGDVPVYTADFDVLKQLTGFPLTRGVLCAMRRRELPSVEDVCAGARRIAILENVMNPTNVGAIFRSAAALNMDAVLLTPACSDPLYRRASRVSMGTVFQIPWTYIGEETIKKTAHPGTTSSFEKQSQDSSSKINNKNSNPAQKDLYCWYTHGLQKLKEMGFKTAAMALKQDSVSIDDPQLMAEEKLAIIL